VIPEFVSPVGVARPGQHGGFLGAEFDPYLVHSDPNLPDYSPGELSLSVGLSPTRIAGRRTLLGLLDRQLGYLGDASVGRSQSAYHRRALDMVVSPAARRAFDGTEDRDATYFLTVASDPTRRRSTPLPLGERARLRSQADMLPGRSPRTPRPGRRDFETHRTTILDKHRIIY